MRKIAALILALLLALACPAYAEGEAAFEEWKPFHAWAEEKAMDQIGTIRALMNDKAYVQMYTGDPSVMEVLPAEAFGKSEYKNVYAVSFESIEKLFDLVGTDTEGILQEFGAFSEEAKKLIDRSLPNIVMSSFNNSMGVKWVMAGSIFRASECYIMPEGFEPCILLFDSGLSAWPCVSFTEAGEGIAMVSASFVPETAFSGLIEGIEEFGAEYAMAAPVRFAKK